MNTILMSLIIMTMTYEMPKLPYANNALEPVISQQFIFPPIRSETFEKGTGRQTGRSHQT